MSCHFITPFHHASASASLCTVHVHGTKTEAYRYIVIFCANMELDWGHNLVGLQYQHRHLLHDGQHDLNLQSMALQSMDCCHILAKLLRTFVC